MRAKIGLTLLLALLLAFPAVAGPYALSVATLILYFAYTGQAWNVMMGFAGQLSLGHSLYVGVGAYAAGALFFHYGIGPWAGLPLAILFCVALGLIIGFLAFRFGISGVYFALLMVFGPSARNVQVDYQLESFEIGKILVDKARLFAALAAVVTAGLLFSFFRFSLVGKAIRACADNHLGALVVGLDVKHLYALTFGLGSVCVAVAGCAMVLLVDVTPPLGPAFTLLAFIIVIVGGLGSMPGALLGGVLIGVSEAMAGLFIAPSAKSMFSFGLLILILLFRPQGLLGKKT